MATKTLKQYIQKIEESGNFYSQGICNTVARGLFIDLY